MFSDADIRITDCQMKTVRVEGTKVTILYVLPACLSFDFLSLAIEY